MRMGGIAYSWPGTQRSYVNIYVYKVRAMTQVQVRIPKKLLEEIDTWVEEGRFKSRSDAIKTIVGFYEEREKTRTFLKMLNDRSEEAEKKTEDLVPLDDVA